MTIDSESLRQTMRLWVSGVTVVTTQLGDRRAGVTASSFTSVSLEPPLVLICLQNYIETFKIITESKIFAISMLRADQAILSKQFAGFVPLPEGEDRFYGVNHTQAITGAPILTDAIAWMDCKLQTIHDVGTSQIIVGEVVATGHQTGQHPLVYHNRGYYDITLQPDN